MKTSFSTLDDLKKLPFLDEKDVPSKGFFQISKDMSIENQLSRSLIPNPDVYFVSYENSEKKFCRAVSSKSGTIKSIF